MASANLGPGVGALDVVVGVAVGGWPKQMSVHDRVWHVPVWPLRTAAYAFNTSLNAAAPDSPLVTRGIIRVLFAQAVMHAAWLPHLPPS